MAQRVSRPDRLFPVVAGVGWIALITMSTTMSRSVSTSVFRSGSALTVGMSQSGGSGTQMMTHDVISPRSILVAVMMWAAMLAVMAPFIGPNVRFISLRSPTNQRRRVAVDVVSGWLMAWCTAAVVLAVTVPVMTQVLGERSMLVVVFAVAAVWQFTATKRSAIAACHRTCAPPLDPRESHTICRAFGVTLGRHCVANCWVLMAAMIVARHSVLVVAPLMWVSWYERFSRPHHDQRRLVSVGVIMVTGAVALMRVTLALPLPSFLSFPSFLSLSGFLS
jgi:predicted metal-binding membrane protein